MVEIQKAVDFCKWIENRARSFEKRRMYRESIECWSKLLRTLTRSHDAEIADVSRLAAIHYRLGVNHQALKENSKSIYHLKYSIRLDASEPRYFEAFGRAFLRGGHLTVARIQFERAVRLDPANSEYLRQYSLVLMLLGKLPEARLYARRALELSPHDAKLIWNLTRIYFESRMYFHSLSVLKRLPVNAEWAARSERLKHECLFHIDQTLEGKVMSALRRGMRLDGRPFHLRHFRMAEQLWVEFSLMENPARSRKINPQAWAAALSLVTLNLAAQESDGDAFGDLLMRFATDSIQVWPAVSKLSQYIECRGDQ